MRAKKFKEVNGACTRKGYGDLPVFYTKDNFIVSCWEMSKEERELFEKTGVIWLSNYGGQPPVMLSVEKPFVIKKVENKG